VDSRRSDKNEPRDPVSLASHTRDPEFQVRRLARVLVGRLDQTSNVLSGDARASQINPFIQCMVCLRSSYHPNDIAELYGGFCHRFHESVEGSKAGARMKKKPAVIEKPPSRAVNITSARMTTRKKPVIAFPTPPEEPETITAIIGGERYRFPFTISVGALEKLEPVAPVMPINRKKPARKESARKE
jgi:hypothetical protein